MICPTRSASSSLSAAVFSLLPEEFQYCNIIVFFIWLILFFVYLFRVMTSEKNKINKSKIKKQDATTVYYKMRQVFLTKCGLYYILRR